MSQRRSRPARRHHVAVLAALGLALVLTGCSGGDADEAGSPTPSTAPTSPAATPSPGSPSASTGPGERGIPTTVDAQVTAVEGDCVYVAPDDAEDVLALRGEVPDVSVGDTLTITGAPDDTEYPGCPDGVPFLVNEIAAG